MNLDNLRFLPWFDRLEQHGANEIIVDLSDLRCPVPILIAKALFRHLPSGVIILNNIAETSVHDITQLCVVNTVAIQNISTSDEIQLKLTR